MAKNSTFLEKNTTCAVFVNKLFYSANYSLLFSLFFPMQLERQRALWVGVQLKKPRLTICEINLPLSYFVALTMLLAVSFPECDYF